MKLLILIILINVADSFDFEQFLRNFKEYLLSERNGIFNLSN